MFGVDILDASLLPALMVALVAGLMSFLSPCVLPIVPPYLAYMSGVTLTSLEHEQSSRRHATITALFFVLGLSTVFLFLGFAASLFGQIFLVNQQWFASIAGIMIMILGGHFIGIFRLGFLDQDVRIDVGERGGSALGAYLLGLAFAFGWTPCIGPILGVILSLAANEGDFGRGTALLVAYAVGLGLPFLAVAAFFPQLQRSLTVLKAHLDRIERIAGLLLWTVGLLMLTGAFTDFSWWLLEMLPVLATYG